MGAAFGSNNADMAVVLPSYGMSPAQADMFQQQMAAKQPKVKPYQTPAVPLTPNKYNDNTVQNIYNDYLAKKAKEYQDWAVQNKASEADLKNHILADNDFKDRVSNFDNLDKMYSALPAQSKVLQQTYGTDNNVPFLNKAIDNFHDAFFQKDDTGKPIAPKPASEVDPTNFNPFQGTETDDFLQNSFNNRNKAIDAHLKSLPTSDITKDYEVRDKAGNVTKKNFNAKTNAFMNVNYDENGRPMGLAVPSSQVELPNAQDVAPVDNTQSNNPLSSNFLANNLQYQQIPQKQTLQVVPPELQQTIATDPKMRFDLLQLAKEKQADLQKQYPTADPSLIHANVLHDYISGNNKLDENGQVTSNGLMSTMYKTNEAQKAPVTKNNFTINLGEGGKNPQPFASPNSLTNLLTHPTYSVTSNDKENPNNSAIQQSFDHFAVMNAASKDKGESMMPVPLFVNSKNLAPETNKLISKSIDDFNTTTEQDRQDYFNSLKTGEEKAAFNSLIAKAKTGDKDAAAELYSTLMNQHNKANGISETFTPADIKEAVPVMRTFNQSVPVMTPKLDNDNNPILDNNGNKVMQPSVSSDGKPVMQTVQKTVFLLPGSNEFRNAVQDRINDVQSEKDNQLMHTLNADIVKPRVVKPVSAPPQQSSPAPQQKPQAQAKAVSGIKWK